jgi:hypothetical protein
MKGQRGGASQMARGGWEHPGDFATLPIGNYRGKVVYQR